jgi:hypothetical protein
MELPRSFPAGPVLRRIADLDREGVRRETVLRVAGARVVFLHRALLQHDFPALGDEALARAHPGLRRKRGEERERAVSALLARWLVQHAALISRPQVTQTEVNSPIRTIPGRAGRRTAHRPPDYGRAVVARVPGGLLDGLLDIKGAGIAPGRRPSFASHGTGLLFLGEALREVAFGELVDAALCHAGSPCRTLPVYGVLDLGFDALMLPEGPIHPAGLLVRRAHRRPPWGGGLKPAGSPLVALELELELLLRRYGLTSVGPMTRIELAGDARRLAVRYGFTPLSLKSQDLRRIRQRTGFAGGALVLEGTNVQLTREAERGPGEAQLVDFGAYRTRERFAGPLASLVSSRLLRLGSILHPHDPRYVQPDPALGLPDRMFDQQGEADLPYDLAKGFRSGALSGDEVRQELDRMIREATARWGSFP